MSRKPNPRLWKDLSPEARRHFIFSPSEWQVCLFDDGYLLLGESLLVEGFVIIDRHTGEKFHASLNSLMEHRAARRRAA